MHENEPELESSSGVPDVHEGPETSVADENSMTTADVNIVKPARNIKGLVKPNQGDSLPSAAPEEGGNHASEPVKIEQKERKIRGLVKPETNDVPAFVKGAVRSGKQKQETSGGKQEKTSTEGMIDNVKDAQDALSRHTEDGKEANCVGEEQSSQKGKKQAEGDEAGGEEKRKAASERGSVASSSGSKNETRSGGNSQPTEEPMDSVAIARIQRELREREEKCTFSPALNPKSMQLAESKERKPLYHLDKPKVEDSQETPQKPALKIPIERQAEIVQRMSVEARVKHDEEIRKLEAELEEKNAKMIQSFSINKRSEELSNRRQAEGDVFTRLSAVDVERKRKKLQEMRSGQESLLLSSPGLSVLPKSKELAMRRSEQGDVITRLSKIDLDVKWSKIHQLKEQLSLEEASSLQEEARVDSRSRRRTEEMARKRTLQGDVITRLSGIDVEAKKARAKLMEKAARRKEDELMIKSAGGRGAGDKKSVRPKSAGAAVEGGGGEDFFERSMKFLEKKKRTLEEKRLQKQQEEAKLLSARPRMSDTSRELASSRGGGAGRAGRRSTDKEEEENKTSPSTIKSTGSHKLQEGSPNQREDRDEQHKAGKRPGKEEETKRRGEKEEEVHRANEHKEKEILLRKEMELLRQRIESLEKENQTLKEGASEKQKQIAKLKEELDTHRQEMKQKGEGQVVEHEQEQEEEDECRFGHLGADKVKEHARTCLRVALSLLSSEFNDEDSVLFANAVLTSTQACGEEELDRTNLLSLIKVIKSINGRHEH
uniref:Uncharacterized protein n=1 Tax=Hanusia phi TaxID=3032 RepID=A0A7S0EDZ3_9CRYP